VHRVNESVLGRAYPDLAVLAARTGRRPEPWRVAVLLADVAEISAAQRAQLDRLARTGVAAGIHLVARGIDIGDSEWIRVEPDGTARTSLTGETVIKLDSPPTRRLVSSVCESLAEQVIGPRDHQNVRGDPVRSPSSRYRALAADLAAAARRHVCAMASAQSAYAVGTAAVEHDIAAAASAINAADAEVTRAERTVAHTDLMVATLWDQLKAVRGRRGRRLGPIPAPAGQSTLGATAHVDNASARVERARRGGQPLPHKVLPLLFLLGATTAAILAGFAALAFWPLILLAPLSGLPMARAWVDHRFGARLDPGALALVVLGGTLATAAAWLLLH